MKKRIKDLFDIKKGKKEKQQDEIDKKSERYIQIEDLRNDDNIKYCIYREKSTFVGSNDIIIAWDGANAGTIAYGLKGVIGSTLARLKPKVANFNTDYVGRYLISKFIYLQDNCTGATVPHINRTVLEKLEVPLPPIQTQKKIVKVLDQAQELIDLRKEQILLLDELIQSIFYDMFGDLVNNSKEWVEREIREVCTDIADCINRTAPVTNYRTEYKMIRTSNIRNGRIDTENVDYVTEEIYKKWTRRLIPIKGDVLFTREAPLGEVALVNTEESIFLGQRIMHYRPNKDLILPEYLLYHLLDRALEPQLIKLASGSTVKHLSVKDCHKFIIKIPPIKLQNEFAQKVQKIEEQKELMQESLSKMEDNFNSLMQKAFKGELFS